MKFCKKVFVTLRGFTRMMSQKNISAFAGSSAFFLFISMIPLLAVLCAILPYTPVTQDMIIRLMKEVAPEMVDGLWAGILQDIYTKKSGVITISVIIAIVSAGKGMLSIIRGLNIINDVTENRNYLWLRIVASFYTIIMLVAVLLMMIILMFGHSVLSIVKAKLPDMTLHISRWVSFRFLISLCLFTLILGIIYTYVPNTKMVFKKQIPGAFFSAFVWTITSWGFSVYIDVFHGFSTYGSLATVIAALVYLYAMMYIMLIGAHMNRYFEATFLYLFGRKKAKKEE